MKNNSNSILNKVSDINTEILTLNRKLQSLEAFHNKFENNLKEESTLRQNIEKKTFYMNESFSTKIQSLNKGFDEFTGMMSEQIENIRGKFMEGQHKNNQQLFQGFEDSLKRLESYEKNSNDLYCDFNLFKSESNSKLASVDDLLSREVKEIKREIRDNNMKIEVFEMKMNENLNTVQKDIGDLIKDVSHIKNDLEMIRNFKENTILNFKDISEEFIRNENAYNKFTNKIYISIQEFESKIHLFEQTFNSHNESFVNIKKDIYNQIYDTNLNVNNKFQFMNEELFEKLESYDKMNMTFQNSLISENDKFTSYIGDQMDSNHKNVKKLVDFTSEDMDLIKNKVKRIILRF